MSLLPPFRDDRLEDRVTERLGQFSGSKVSWDLRLERIRSLLAALGNPQNRVPIVHVAGTNGKGSVCAYVSSVLTAAGYRTGRYTSPHLVSWTERISLDDRSIPTAELLDLVHEVAEAAIGLAGQPLGCPSQFEVITAVAWLYFARQAVDLAVIEVGLGGRLDATNVVDRPLACAIVSIGRDHWQVLGDSLAAIAQEKAGILKAGCPAVIGPMPPEAAEAITRQADMVGAPLTWVKPAVLIDRPLIDFSAADRSPMAELDREPKPESPQPESSINPDDLPWAKAGSIAYPLALTGAIQQTNSAIAIALIEQLRDQGWQISDRAIQTGMAATRWPGRLAWTTWTIDGVDRPLLIDGAHNEPAAIALRQYVDTYLQTEANVHRKDSDCKDSDRKDSDRKDLDPDSPRSTTWVIGMLSSKDAREICCALLRPGDRLATVPIDDPATIDPQALRAIGLTVCPDLAAAEAFDDWRSALHWALTPETVAPVVLCGSLYLLGEIYQNLSTIS